MEDNYSDGKPAGTFMRAPNGSRRVAPLRLREQGMTLPRHSPTVREAADHIGVQVSQIHRWIKAGVLKVDGTEQYEIGRGAMGRRYLLSAESVEAQAKAIAAMRRRRPIYMALNEALDGNPLRPYLSKKVATSPDL